MTFLITSCTFLTPSPTITNPGAESPTQIIQACDYEYLSEEKRIDQSDAIFVETVLKVAAPRWNQNSGEPWQTGDRSAGPNQHDALLYQTLEVEVTQAVVDMLGIGPRVTITFLGNLPLYSVNPGVPVQPSDKVIFTIRRNEIACREGGRKNVFYFVGDPTLSCLIQASDSLFKFPADPGEKGISLDEKIRKIAARRETLVQPLR